jgi:sucrose-6-phosphate hydrolase SacC (GH32 family)
MGRPTDLYERGVDKLTGSGYYQYLDAREGKVKTIRADDPRIKTWEKSGYFYFSEPENAYILEVPEGLPLDTKTGTKEVAPPKKTQMVKSASGIYEFKRKGGSTKGYSGTYSGGVYYQEGGAFVPQYAESAYGDLPKYMYGMQDGGSAGDEMYVTPEQMEMLRQQGYDFDIIG